MAENLEYRNEHERRVQGILARTRQELAVRDLMSFSLAKVWIVLLTLAAGLWVWFEQRSAERPRSESSL